VPNQLTFTLAGLPETMVALEQLTPELVNDVERMQRDIAEAAAANIRAQYVYKTGALVKGVRTKRLLKGRVVAAMVVENTHWLAGVYDHGSMTVRETKAGYNRGTMPSRPIFTRTMNEAKRVVALGTVEILRRHGLTVLHVAA
jgi:hypothetical protein